MQLDPNHRPIEDVQLPVDPVEQPYTTTHRRPPCYGGCGKPAGHPRWPASAWCADCQVYDLRPAVEGFQCPACCKNLPSLSSFDEHYREAHETRTELRTQRRTVAVAVRSLTPGPGWPEVEVYRACDPDCRNSLLGSLEVPAHGSWGYPSFGTATTEVRGQLYTVEWKRNQPGTADCCICGSEWRFEIPPLEAQRLARSARMKGTLPAGLTPRRPGEPLPGGREQSI